MTPSASAHASPAAAKEPASSEASFFWRFLGACALLGLLAYPASQAYRSYVPAPMAQGEGAGASGLDQPLEPIEWRGSSRPAKR